MGSVKADRVNRLGGEVPSYAAACQAVRIARRKSNFVRIVCTEGHA